MVFFGDTLSGQRNDAREWREVILKAIEGSSETVKKSLLIIHEFSETGRTGNIDEVRTAIETIQHEQPTLFDELKKMVARGAIEGTAGNAFYGLLVQIFSSLPAQ